MNPISDNKAINHFFTCTKEGRIYICISLSEYLFLPANSIYYACMSALYSLFTIFSDERTYPFLHYIRQSFVGRLKKYFQEFVDLFILKKKSFLVSRNLFSD